MKERCLDHPWASDQSGHCWRCEELKNQHYMGEEFKVDSIVASVIEQFKIRAKKGKDKYGTDLDRNDLSLLEWIEHAQQEHMDAILYLEKIKQSVKN